jgi:23S rRNA pseudouridine2605 synthase
MALERLQKVLAQAGLAARRKTEILITDGRVRVDGVVVTTLGTKVDPRKQRIEVDGRRVFAEHVCYGILHKPRGMVTTASDPEGRPTALDLLRDVGVRVVPVGRLDFNTSGALLFTNDGDFANVLSHARGNVPKVYAAKVQTRVEPGDLGPWMESIEIDGKMTRPAEVRILRQEADKTWIQVTLREGKNHQVRRLGEHAGAEVVRLSRLSHAGIGTEGLRPGQWRMLTLDELKALKQQYGVPEKVRAPAPLPPRDPAVRAPRGTASERTERGRFERTEHSSTTELSGSRGRGSAIRRVAGAQSRAADPSPAPRGSRGHGSAIRRGAGPQSGPADASSTPPRGSGSVRRPRTR